MKQALFGFGGLLIGGLLGGLIGYRLGYQKAYSIFGEEVDEALQDYQRAANTDSQDVSGPEDENKVVSENSREGARFTESNPSQIDYTGFYGTKGVTEDDEEYVDVTEVENEHPSDDERAVQEMEKIAYERQENMGKPPRIISIDQVGGLPSYISEECLFYYPESDVLCTEDGAMIDEPGLLVGQALDKYDFRNSDETQIFVLNYQLDTCYDIQKVGGLYEP